MQHLVQDSLSCQKIVKLPSVDLTQKHSNQTVFCHVVNPVQYAISQGLPQKKGVRPDVEKTEIKYVKGVSFVNHCLSAKSVPNVPNVVTELGVGGRLQKFWPKWETLGANPRVVSILCEGYTLPFKMRPPLSRFPLITSGYANPTRSLALSQALGALVEKLVVEKVVVRTSLSFYNRLFLVPKPDNKWRPILDLSQLNLFLKTNTFKMETPETIRVSLQKGEWVTSLDFSDAYFHIPIHPRSRKYLRFFLNSKAYQFTALPFGLATAPLEFTKVVKEVKLMAQARGIRIHQYLDDWFLRAPDPGTCQQNTQTLLALCRELGWVVNMKKSELVPQQIFNFVGYRFDLLTGRVLPTLERWETLRAKLLFVKSKDSCTVRQLMSLIGLLTATEKQVWLGRLDMRPIQWHLKKHWHVPEILDKEIPVPPYPPPSSGLVVGGKEYTPRPTITSNASRSTSFYRRIKRRLGRSLRGLHSKRRLVRTRKSPPHKLLGTKSSLPGAQEFRASLQGSDCPSSHRQHNCGLLHQQGRRYEIRLSLCPPVETSVVVPPQGDNPPSEAHPGSPKCDSGQTVQAQPGDPDRMVSVSTGVSSLVLQMGSPTTRPFCHPVQSQTSQICVTGSGSDSVGCRRPQHIMGNSGCVRLSPSCIAQSSSFKSHGPGVSQNGANCTRFAQHGLVLGSGGSVYTNPFPASAPQGSGDSTCQWPPTQESHQSKPTCMAPRASIIQEQGFADEVAARIEAPQRSSTRAVYKSKWTIFVKWCDSHKVDFRSPSVNQIADFLLYLFKDRKLQPSTIDGYRTAIADMVGNQEVNISKDENLTRLLDSFHRDKPKGRHGVPSWNLSLVLHQLTKAPFEPMRKASLKHLTFKTVFLLALGSGKRRSEIHAWLFKNIRHQESWSQVSLYPSPMFISKNQLAREGPTSVAPVVIPALAPSLDRDLTEDRSLCPVRALRYYLDRTKDLRKGKELVFVSFRKSFQKDIVLATISSWIKQTVLCYQLSDEDTQNLLQVKAHDVRAFAASKAFQGGVSLDQILSPCHWKAHNTFTQFYLKDLAWADSELYHLGPIVAAQQVHEEK